VRAALDHGFVPVERLAGGRAAVFTEETIAIAWARAERDPWPGTHDRFREIAGVIQGALERLGVDARVGEIPGEYCPGEYSINARGRTKLVGIGQRIIRGAWHIGGVIVVRDSARIRDVLIPVYEALGLPFDPDTTGSVEDELGSASWDEVAGALLAEWGAGRGYVEVELDPETLALAERLEAEHASPVSG
jgi:lipoate-protein ligase A